jgi:diguanylate cyclase (GGDEF)-like protein/PAS domain S-box-containing protein
VYEYTPYALPTAATTLLLLVSGALVFARRPSRLSAAFLGMTSIAAIWQAAFTVMYLSADAPTALLWARLAYVAVPFLAPAVYQFSLEVLRMAERRIVAIVGAWALAAFFSALGLGTDLLISRVEHYWWGYYPRYGLATSIPFLIFFFGYLVAALAELLHGRPAAEGGERRRIDLLLTALGLAYVGSVDYLPKYGLAVYPFGYLAILAFVLVVAYAVRRYDLVALTPSLAAREIIGTMADALFVCDHTGRIQFANNAAEVLLGMEGRELTGSKFEELLLNRPEGFGASLRRSSIRNAEFTFRGRSGEPLPLTLSIAPVVQAGEAAGAVIIGRDVRDLRRAEREIRRAVILLQSTLDSTADGILVTDDTGRILAYNQPFVEMWRIPRHALASGSDRTIIAAVADQLHDPETFSLTVESLYAQPEAESFDLIEFKDGRRFERYSIGRRIEEIANVRVWSFRDITARFAAEAALRESEIRYRLLFEQNAAGVCVTRGDGEIVDCNTTFAFMLGYKRNDLIASKIGDLYERRFEGEELAAMLFDSPMLNGVEVELRRRDGSSVWVLQNLSLVGQGDSAVIHATVVDISDRKRAEEQIEFHAYHDVLTHLPNRRLFTDRLGLGITRARRSGRPLAVMFIDLDHFKTVNDTLGHNAGDDLLLEMSRRLRHCVREDDTVARLGGDEFTIILSELRHPEDAAQVAQKILEAVQVPLSIAGTPLEVSASIGIAIYPADGGDAESLLRSADNAMYRAKEAGRNTYQLCTEEMKTRAVQRLTLEAKLRRAIQERQFVIRYQPQVSVATGRIAGVEALLRWNDPEQGLIDPKSFLPLAEDSRLIVPLGQWVLRSACEQVRAWKELGLLLRVAVNLSTRQFQQADFVETVRRILQETGVAPSSLELEITETTAMQNVESTVAVLEALRELGVAVSIDDFGTGYSSLHSLKRFPVTAVKIDPAFIQDISASGQGGTIAGAMIDIARSLEIRVIAEGVETEAQFAFLRRRECDEAQGFYFSRPLPPDLLTRLLTGDGFSDAGQPRLRV